MHQRMEDCHLEIYSICQGGKITVKSITVDVDNGIITVIILMIEKCVLGVNCHQRRVLKIYVSCNMEEWSWEVYITDIYTTDTYSHASNSSLCI